MTRAEAVNWIINISADIGKTQHSELWHYEQALSEIRDMLETEPEEKTGEWIKVTNGRGGYECSICHEYAPNYQSGNEYLSNYCPRCGKKMKLEK